MKKIDSIVTTAPQTVDRFTKVKRATSSLTIYIYGTRESGKTSFVLAGDNMGPSKLQKAEKLGVPVINEDDFLKMINEDNQQ